MAAAAKTNGFFQKLMVTVISGAALLFFGWLSWTVVDIQIVAGRMDERMIQMDLKITSLVNASASRTSRQVQGNTERLDAIEGNGQ